MRATACYVATGALLLFSAVQAGMLGYGFSRGERFAPIQWLGLLAAMSGVVMLLYPGLSAPPVIGSLAMLSVPVLAAVAGAFILDEALDARLVVASVAVLGGILLVLLRRRSGGQAPIRNAD